MKTLIGLVLATGLLGCVSGDSGPSADETSPSGDGKADGSHVPASGTPEACGALRIANEATRTELEHDVRLRTQAAAAIIKHRAGTDRVLGTADDDRFDTVAELDHSELVNSNEFFYLIQAATLNGYVDDCAAQPVALGDSLHSGDFVEFHVTSTDLMNAVGEDDERVELRTIDPLRTTYETFRNGLDLGMGWRSFRELDGAFLLDFDASEVGTTCYPDDRFIGGVIEEVHVPAGTFIACKVVTRTYEDHGYYTTDNFVTTWYGPVAHRAIKVQTDKNYGSGQMTTSVKELTAFGP